MFYRVNIKQGTVARKQVDVNNKILSKSALSVRAQDT